MSRRTMVGMIQCGVLKLEFELTFENVREDQLDGHLRLVAVHPAPASEPLH